MTREAYEDAVDALDHIARVCRGSNTQTRRIRWLKVRAESGLTGSEDFRRSIPSTDDTVANLREMIELVFPFVRDAAAGLRVMVDELASDPANADRVKEYQSELNAFEGFVAGVRKHMGWILSRYPQPPAEESKQE